MIVVDFQCYELPKDETQKKKKKTRAPNLISFWVIHAAIPNSVVKQKEM